MSKPLFAPKPPSHLKTGAAPLSPAATTAARSWCVRPHAFDNAAVKALGGVAYGNAQRVEVRQPLQLLAHGGS